MGVQAFWFVTVTDNEDSLFVCSFDIRLSIARGKDEAPREEKAQKLTHGGTLQKPERQGNEFFSEGLDLMMGGARNASSSYGESTCNDCNE